MKKKVRVVMLPTEKAENSILKHRNGKLQYFGNKYFTQDYLIETERKSFQMYLISNEEIKEGDWCILLDDYGNVMSNPQQWLGEGVLNSGLRKVIATTDKSLKWHTDYEIQILDHYHCQFPQIPQSFIETYVKANGEIDEVELECVTEVIGQCSCMCHYPGVNMMHIVACCRPEYKHTIKVNENNEVIIYLKNTITMD